MSQPRIEGHCASSGPRKATSVKTDNPPAQTIIRSRWSLAIPIPIEETRSAIAQMTIAVKTMVMQEFYSEEAPDRNKKERNHSSDSRARPITWP